MLEEIINALVERGWYRYLGEEDLFHWKTKNSNRYVDIELPYIDLYVYADGEKYKTYLAVDELNTFNSLIQFLNNNQEGE